MSSEALPPGSRIGILGGGQLGRMLAMAAARLGFRAVVFDPAEDPPAAHLARHLRASFEDADALATFAAGVDVVTFEFENVPAATAEILARHAPVRPSPGTLAIAQDRVAEKQFLNQTGIATAPWAAVSGPGDLAAALGDIGCPAILKSRRFGYDGKGQAPIARPEDAAAAWEAIGCQPAILEGRVGFDLEISVIAARGLDGRVVCYDPGANRHDGGILRETRVPAPIARPVLQDAVLSAGRIVTALDYVGVMGVEMFAVGRRLLVNEIAPRVHNTGHWTMEACLIDQFEQHIRAVTGWPLGDGRRHSDAVMENLIGSDIEGWANRAAEDAALHIYGKSAARPGRKMGHITRLHPRTG
ncbi:MAG: 5-(carboxyamino)imidazole ribonucleotide synthase [Paracoccaceae bacterium]